LRLKIPRLEHRDDFAGAHDFVLEQRHLPDLRADLRADVGLLARPNRADRDDLRSDFAFLSFRDFDADDRSDFRFGFGFRFFPTPDDQNGEAEDNHRDYPND
jgi:hypothetical protein